MSSTSPPSRTRTQCSLPTSAYQSAPEASKQMPSGWSPGVAAQVRASPRVPSSAIGYAVSFSPYDSATTRVEPSGLMAMPLGKASPSATTRVEPSASTRATSPGANSPPGKSNPMLFT